MRKILLIILLWGSLLFEITGCFEKTNEEHSFYGKILEVSSSYIIVEPDEDEMVRKSSDKFYIALKNDDTNYEVGTNVKITYIGGINESYPAQIGTTKIEVVESKKTKLNYTKKIDDITLEMNIPSDWQYEELTLDENDDFYNYELKLYKNDKNKYARLSFYNNDFAVCGTGRKQENIVLNNGEEAIIGYYYCENNAWSDISFDSNRHLAFINYGLESAEAEEFLDFIKTVNIK